MTQRLMYNTNVYGYVVLSSFRVKSRPPSPLGGRKPQSVVIGAWKLLSFRWASGLVGVWLVVKSQKSTSSATFCIHLLIVSTIYCAIKRGPGWRQSQKICPTYTIEQDSNTPSIQREYIYTLTITNMHRFASIQCFILESIAFLHLQINANWDETIVPLFIIEDRKYPILGQKRTQSKYQYLTQLWLSRDIFVCIRPVSYVPNDTHVSLFPRGLSWSSSYGSWISNYLCNQY